MDFAIPAAITRDLNRFRDVIQTQLLPELPSWTKKQKMTDTLLPLLGAGGWYGLKMKGERLVRGSALREAMIAEELAKTSPGVAIVVLAHVDLGLMAIFLFGSQGLHHTYGASAVQGKTVMYDHPIHKYPLDAWAASLGEGTQDVQKLIIFQELIKNYR